MPLRILLAVLVALACPTSQAWATGPQFGPMSGGGSGVVANTCTAGDFFSAVDGSGNFTCSTPSGSGDVTAVGDCASGACFTGASGTTLTGSGASTVLQGPGSMYFNIDTDASSAGDGFVVANNASGTGGTALFEINESNNAYLYNNMALRFREATANGSSAVIVSGPASMTTSPTISWPEASGTVAVSATSPVALSAAGAISITADGIGSTELAPTFTATTITSNLVGNVTGNADTATLATTATTANAGDSATSFFSSGELERTLLPAASADCLANQFAKGVDADFVLDCSQPDHGGMAGLSDDDHTQYFLLAGRTLADPAAATTVIARQTTSSPLAMTNGSGFEWLEWDADLTIPNTSTIQVFSVMGSLDRTGTSGGDLYQYTGFYGQPTLSSATTGGPLFQDMFYDASIIDQTANTATQNTWVPISFLSKPTYKVSGTGTLTIGKTMAGNTDPNLTETGTGNLTITELIGWNVMDATTTAGTPTVTEQVGFRCEDLTAGTTDTCYKSEGTSVLFKHAGQARIGATGAPTANFDLDVQGATKVADYMDVGDDIADITTGTVGVITAGDTVNISSNGDLSGLLFTPTTTNSSASSGELYGVYFSPTLSSNSIDTISAVSMAGTVTQTAKVATLFSGAAYILNHNTTYQSATAAVHPREGVFALNNLPTVTMSATSSSATQPNNIAVVHNPTVSNTGAGGTFTLTNDVGLKMDGTYTETAGTLQVTNRIGLDFNDVTNTSSATAITTNIGVDIAALSTATTNIGIRNADTTVYTPAGAQSISATSSSLTPSATALQVTATGAIGTLTSNPQVSDGVDGQIIHIVYSQAANSFTFADGNGLQLAGTMLMDQGNTLTLMYNSALGDWVEIARALN